MSIRIDRDQQYVVYPPADGTDGAPCYDYPGSCAHIDCMTMHRFAARICPECHEPIGYGGLVPIGHTDPDQRWYSLKTSDGTVVYLHDSDLVPLHAACYDKLVAAQAAPSDAAAVNGEG